MFLTVDRTEHGIVLMQDTSGIFYHFPVSALPSPPQDGAVYEYCPFSPISLVLREDMTAKNNQRARKLFDSLLAR